MAKWAGLGAQPFGLALMDGWVTWSNPPQNMLSFHLKKKNISGKERKIWCTQKRLKEKGCPFFLNALHFPPNQHVKTTYIYIYMISKEKSEEIMRSSVCLIFCYSRWSRQNTTSLALDMNTHKTFQNHPPAKKKKLWNYLSTIICAMV